MNIHRRYLIAILLGSLGFMGLETRADDVIPLPGVFSTYDVNFTIPANKLRTGVSSDKTGTRQIRTYFLEGLEIAKVRRNNVQVYQTSGYSLKLVVDDLVEATPLGKDIAACMDRASTIAAGGLLFTHDGDPYYKKLELRIVFRTTRFSPSLQYQTINFRRIRDVKKVSCNII